MATSASIQEKIVTFLADNKSHSVQEIKVFLEQSKIGDYTEGQFAGSINTLLRNGTIRKIDRGVYALWVKEEDMKQCFIISPIGPDGSEIRKDADTVFRHIIKPVCDACDFKAVRVDKLNDANCINDTVIEFLDTAELVIADMTGHNPNVFYEMGYRKRTKKPMIHLKKKGETIPFDVTSIRTLEYDLTDLDSVEEVKDRLKKTIESFSYLDSSESPIEEKSVDSAFASIVQILYQVLDAVDELKSDMRNFSSDTIGTVVRAVQSSQPPVSPDAAWMTELVKNPENFLKILQISEQMERKNNFFHDMTSRAK